MKSWSTHINRFETSGDLTSQSPKCFFILFSCDSFCFGVDANEFLDSVESGEDRRTINSDQRHSLWRVDAVVACKLVTLHFYLSVWKVESKQRAGIRG